MSMDFSPGFQLLLYLSNFPSNHPLGRDHIGELLPRLIAGRSGPKSQKRTSGCSCGPVAGPYLRVARETNGFVAPHSSATLSCSKCRQHAPR